MSEVTKEQVAEWKAKYGRVAKLPLGGVDWYYRPINLLVDILADDINVPSFGGL